jgi:hypothetical protein
MAAGGRRGRAMRSLLQARQEFAGYWEYLLEDALFSAPALPLWSGAAMIDATGALVGIGSLRLEQREDDGRITPFNMSVPPSCWPPSTTTWCAAGRSAPHGPGWASSRNRSAARWRWSACPTAARPAAPSCGPATPSCAWRAARG